jgi:hypothetical protein
MQVAAAAAVAFVHIVNPFGKLSKIIKRGKRKRLENGKRERKFKLNVRYTDRPGPCTHSSLATF